MVNRAVIQKRVYKVNEYLGFLCRISEEYDLKGFKGDPMAYGSAERFLHLSIEALIDIGNHIVADQGLGRVEAYSDIPRVLSVNGYLDERLKKIFIKMVGFRNILVHDYLDVDLEIVYSILRNNIDDLTDILKEFMKFI